MYVFNGHTKNLVLAIFFSLVVITRTKVLIPLVFRVVFCSNPCSAGSRLFQWQNNTC